MNTHADKPQTKESPAVANRLPKHQHNSGSTFQFVDNRPEAIAQRKFQDAANNSPQADQTAQFQAVANNHADQQNQPLQKKENNTGLPDNLKSGVENLSGYSMDDVNVHYNSDQPAQLDAHAYAQGTDIHIAPGQEEHLPHEAWHVVQQKQGRVKPTMQMKGNVSVNDDEGLEKEADVMGKRAIQGHPDGFIQSAPSSISYSTIQRAYAQQPYTGSRNRQREISADNHAVHWGGAPSNNRPNRGINRAILYETVSNSTQSIAALLTRIDARKADNGGNGVWDVGLTLALNSWYVPERNNTDTLDGQQRPLNTPVRANEKLAYVQNSLDNQRNALLNNWSGPPLNITTVAWERHYTKEGNQDPVLEGARGNVPFATLRKFAAKNANADAIHTELEKGRTGTVWRKMGDDDMPIPEPNGNTPEMRDLASIENNAEGITTFATFGYNLTTAGLSPAMDNILQTVYRKEMSLRQKLIDINVKTYPIEPNTYYKFADNDAFNSAWDGVENMDVGGGAQIKEGLRLKKSADDRYTEQKAFHNTMLNTDAGGRNQALIVLLDPALGKAARGEDHELTVPAIIDVLSHMDQSYFQPGVWRSVAAELMSTIDINRVYDVATKLIKEECRITATEIWYICDHIAKVARIKV